MIEFEGAAAGYDGRDVLSGVDLRLEPGSLRFVTGRSGAGKTTVLRLVYLALRPVAGAVRIFGRDSKEVRRKEEAALRRRMGVVLQDCDLLEHMSVIENLALPLRVAGRRGQSETDVEALARWVGLGKHLDARPRELSAGERQRAAIARAVVANPELVVADEPTGNVDAEAAGRIMGLFVELNRLGKTVLIATHDLNLMRAAKGSRASVLKVEGGRVERAGAPL